MADREKVVSHLNDCMEASRRDNTWVFVRKDIVEDAIVLLKEQDAKPPVHIHEEYPEHDWERKENGDIDDFAYDGDYHNGPMCKRCYYSSCIHCDPNGWNKKPCIIDEYNCPKCGRYISKGTKFCSDCGQAVKWNEAQCPGAILD
jgi:hypothetical protein